jgi:hypothetical protein
MIVDYALWYGATSIGYYSRREVLTRAEWERYNREGLMGRSAEPGLVARLLCFVQVDFRLAAKPVRCKHVVLSGGWCRLATLW